MVSAPPTPDTMIATRAIQPIIIITEGAYISENYHKTSFDIKKTLLNHRMVCLFYDLVFVVLFLLVVSQLCCIYGRRKTILYSNLITFLLIVKKMQGNIL